MKQATAIVASSTCVLALALSVTNASQRKRPAPATSNAAPVEVDPVAGPSRPKLGQHPGRLDKAGRERARSGSGGPGAVAITGAGSTEAKRLFRNRDEEGALKAEGDPDASAEVFVDTPTSVVMSHPVIMFITFICLSPQLLRDQGLPTVCT
jgi:hypothetical protein